MTLISCTQLHCHTLTFSEVPRRCPSVLQTQTSLTPGSLPRFPCDCRWDKGCQLLSPVVFWFLLRYAPPRWFQVCLLYPYLGCWLAVLVSPSVPVKELLGSTCYRCLLTYLYFGCYPVLSLPFSPFNGSNLFIIGLCQ